MPNILEGPNVAPLRKKPRPPPQPPALPGDVRVRENANLAVYTAEQTLGLPHEIRFTPTGETTTAWMARRWSGVLGRAGWDPTRVPIPLLHDLATSGVSDPMLMDALGVLAPLQETLLERLRERNDRQALAESMLPNMQARARGKRAGELLARREAQAVPEPDHSVAGWEQDKLRREMLGLAVPGLESPAAFKEGAERAREEFANRAIPYPQAVDNLTEIAGTPELRRRLDAAPWLLQFLTQQPKDERGLAAAKASLLGYLNNGRALPDTLRQAGRELLQDGENPLGVAYMLAMWQTHPAGELRAKGIVDPGQVLERARMNREELPQNLATATGGIVGREKLPLLAFDPRDEVEQARLEASGQMAALGTGFLHPGKALDALYWPYSHVVSPVLGTAVQLLKPINDALIVRRPNLTGEQAPGPLVAGPGKPIVEWHPEAFGQLVTPAEAWRRAQAGGLGGAVAELGGIRPGDKDYKAAAAVFDLVAGFYLDPFIAASRVGAGVKAARSIPVADEVATSSLLRRVTRLYPEAQIPEVPHSKLSRLAYQAFARNPEELVATNAARRTFASMARETDPIVLADRYHIPPALADAIAGQRDPHRIRDLVVAGMRGAIPTYERFEIEARVLRNQAEIDRLERLGGGTQPGLFPGQSPVNPYQPRINALRRQTAEMTADLQTGERLALEVRGMPLDTLAGSYRQAVKRFASDPARVDPDRPWASRAAMLAGRAPQGQQSFLDALVRSSRSYQERQVGRLDEATRVELDRHRRTGERWRKDLEELYKRRAAGDVGVEQQIADAEKALDKLAATTGGIMERQGLSDQHRLWLARERLGASNPGLRALSWAYNRYAQLRSPFELLPQTGDVISITDKAQGLRVMERLGLALDVDRATLDAALRGYLRATGPEDSRAAVMELIKAARGLHPEYSNEMLRMWRNNSESLFWLADGDGRDMWAARKTWMGDEMPFSQPHLSSELLTEIPLPDWRAVRDMRKLSTRAILRLKSPTPVLEPEARIARVAARFGVNPHKLTSVSKLIDAPDRVVSTVVAEGWAKAIRAQDILLHRVWTPSVLIRGGWTTRVVGEEQLRMASVGLASGVWHPARWWDAARARGEFARFADRPEGLLVNYTRDVWQKQPTAIRITKGTHGYTTAWRQELAQLAGAQEMRVFLQHVANEGEGAAATSKTVRWLATHPDGQAVWEQMRPIVGEVLGEADDAILMEKWVDTFRQRVHDKTRGNQALVALARDGEIRMPIDEFAALKFGGDIPRRLQIALEEYQDLLRAGKPIPFELRAELEHELGVGLINGQGGTLKAHVPLSDDVVVEKFLDALPDTAKPNRVKGRGFNWDDEAKPVSWVNAAMEVLGGKPTNFASRLPAYRQFAAREYARLRGMGISAERCEARARTYAIEQTRQLLYELGERSALADQMTAFSRFFNAWQEVTERWLLHIPARQGVFGHAAMVRRAQLMFDAAEESGLFYKNDRGEWVTKLPGVEWLASHVLGVPMKAEFGLRGFNMIGNLPGLNPWTLKALVSLPTVKEWWDKPGPARFALDVLAPYGSEVNMGPAWMGRAWWALTKQAPPWEYLSARYQKMLWDGSVVDAMRVLDAKAKKDTGQSVLQRLASMPEGPEKDALFQDYLRDAEGMGRHFFLLRAGAGFLLPAQPQWYWPNNDEAQAFYDQLNALPEGSPARRAMYAQFIEDHPELTSYLVGKSTAKPGTPRPTEADDEFSLRAYWRQVETGARKRLVPEDWARYAAGANDYQVINHDYRVETAAAGDTAAERLRNYGQVLEASARRASRIERLRQQNPLWSAQFDIQLEGSRVAGGQDRRTFEQHVAADFANDVKVITDLVNDTPLEDTVDLGELRRARHALLDKWGTDYDQIAAQDTIEGEIARYFRDTMDPYFAKLDGLYEQANALPRAERGPFYNQVRELRNTYQTPEGMPTPEEVLFGMADEQQQTELRWKWASQPPGWLSNFQRETAGLPVAPLTEQFWTTVNQVEAAVRGYIQEQHWIPTQKQAIDMMAGFEQWKVGFADQHGLGEEVAREQLAPFDRAYVAKQLPEPYWQPLVQTLGLVKQALAQVSTNRDGTPASIDSMAGRPVFDAFAAWLDRARASAPDLDDALTRWGKILGDADQPLVGVDLYRVLLFGEFR